MVRWLLKDQNTPLEDARAGLVELVNPKKVHLYEHGYVVLDKVMGDDLDIVNNAKASFDVFADEVGATEKAILNFLMRDRHGSPWEAVVFRFLVRGPIFANREWFRHRMASYNEESLRYSKAKEEFYIPPLDHIRTQTGKPGAYTFTQIEDPNVIKRTIDLFTETQQAAISAYHEILEMGVAREVARDVLPVSMFSTFVWTVNLRSLFNFLALRNDSHALREIREYAQVVEQLASEACPYAFELFNKHGRVCP